MGTYCIIILVTILYCDWRWLMELSWDFFHLPTGAGFRKHPQNHLVSNCWLVVKESFAKPKPVEMSRSSSEPRVREFYLLGGRDSSGFDGDFMWFLHIEWRYIWLSTLLNNKPSFYKDMLIISRSCNHQTYGDTTGK